MWLSVTTKESGTVTVCRQTLAKQYLKDIDPQSEMTFAIAMITYSAVAAAAGA